MDKLPIPDFCNFSRANDWSYPIDYQQLLTVSSDYRNKFDIPSASDNQPNVKLLLIDTQKDFTLKEGALFVGGRSGEGAIEDSKRTAAFIYENLRYIKDIYSSYDTHTALQIFFPTFWLDKDDKPVAPYTTISSESIRNGLYKPNPEVAHLCERDYDYLHRYVMHYCKSLEYAGKYQLYIWPFHCLVGSEGHAMNGLIQEACSFHAFTKRAQTHFELKGTNPWTENYSVFSPEVLFDHKAKTIGSRNSDLFDDLFESDILVIAGQALSHCLHSSVDDLIQEAMVRNPDFLSRIYLLEDCMSSVVVPGVMDFTEQAEFYLNTYKGLGINVVSSTQPLKRWPGVPNFI